MSPHFQSYASNLNRMRLIEMIDHHSTRLRHAKARPSIVHNPLSTQSYYDGLREQKTSQRLARSR
jgi:hypothetical protein